MPFKNLSHLAFLTLLPLVLTACGGGSSDATPAVGTGGQTYQVAGSLTGLQNGMQLTLRNNATDELTVTANGGFSFPTALAKDAPYAVTIGAKPEALTCLLANSSGTVGSANVNNVQVACSPAPQQTFTVGGTTAGLASGTRLTLALNGDAQVLDVASNGGFTFGGGLFNGAIYQVTVATQPAGQQCAVTRGSGSIVSADVNAVAVSCQTSAPATQTVGGSLSGLAAAANVVLQNNAGDSLTLNANGSFTFATRVAVASTYAVSVLTQPAGQTCTVARGSGTVGNAAVANVAVSCQTNAPSTFTIGGSLTGLSTGSSLVLQNRNGSNLTLNTNGSFTFANSATTGSPYAVTVLTQPAGATCAVTSGVGSVAGANVTSPAVVCAPNPAFSVGGSVNSLAVGGALVLLNNGTDETTVFANGSFVFGSAVNSGQPYAVTVKVQPAGQQCAVTNGSGPVTNANIASVTIDCVSDFQYAFTTNANGSTGAGGNLNFAPGSVSVYAIQRATGAVGKLGADVNSGGLGVSSVAVHPSGTLAAVSNRGSNTTPGNVVMFIVNVGTGAVTKVGTYAAGSSPKSVVFSKSGAHLLVANEGSGNVSVFDVQATGALTEVANSPFASGGPNPNFLTMTPSGNHALVSNFGTNTVAVMSFDATSGGLAQVAGSPYTAGGGPVDIAVTPDSGLVYVINHATTTGTVSVFAMDSAGRLTARPSQTPSTGPYGIAISPNGQYAYVAEFGGSGSVLAFRINAATGALTPLANGTYSTVGLNYSIAINKAGTTVLVTNWGDPGLPVPTNKVTAFSANTSTGALTPVAGSPLPTGLFPEIVAIGP